MDPGSKNQIQIYDSSLSEEYYIPSLNLKFKELNKLEVADLKELFLISVKGYTKIQLEIAQCIHSQFSFQEKLYQIIEDSKKLPEQSTYETPTAASIAITILNFANISFEGKNFAGIKIPFANLQKSIFHYTELSNACLQGCNLTKACISQCNLYNANLKDVELPIHSIYESSEKISYFKATDCFSYTLVLSQCKYLTILNNRFVPISERQRLDNIYTEIDNINIGKSLVFLKKSKKWDLYDYKKRKVLKQNISLDKKTKRSLKFQVTQRNENLEILPLCQKIQPTLNQRVKNCIEFEVIDDILIGFSPYQVNAFQLTPKQTSLVFSFQCKNNQSIQNYDVSSQKMNMMIAISIAEFNQSSVEVLFPLKKTKSSLFSPWKYIKAPKEQRVKFYKDEQYLIVYGQNSILLYSIQTEQLITKLTHGNCDRIIQLQVKKSRISQSQMEQANESQGKRCEDAIISRDNTQALFFWGDPIGQEVIKSQANNLGKILQLKVFTDKNTQKNIIFTTSNTQIMMWEPENNSQGKLIFENKFKILSSDISPNMKHIALCDEKGNVSLVEISTGKIISQFASVQTYTSSSQITQFIKYTEDGSYVLSCNQQGVLFLRDPTNLKKFFSSGGEQLSFNCLEVSKGSSKYFAFGANDCFKIGDVKRFSILKTQRSNRSIVCISFSVDNNYMAYSALDKAIHIWDLKTQKLFKTIIASNLNVTSLDYSSTELVSSSEDYDIKIWDLQQDYALKQQIKVFTEAVKQVRFDSTETKIVACDGSDSIRCFKKNEQTGFYQLYWQSTKSFSFRANDLTQTFFTTPILKKVQKQFLRFKNTQENQIMNTNY